MSEYIIKCEDSMKASIDHLKSSLGKVRTGRANADMLDGITVL